jgi:hypothetical protein
MSDSSSDISAGVLWGSSGRARHPIGRNCNGWDTHLTRLCILSLTCSGMVVVLLPLLWSGVTGVVGKAHYGTAPHLVRSIDTVTRHSPCTVQHAKNTTCTVAILSMH